jgi:hypothetical protein
MGDYLFDGESPSNDKGVLMMWTEPSEEKKDEVVTMYITATSYSTGSTMATGMNEACIRAESVKPKLDIPAELTVKKNVISSNRIKNVPRRNVCTGLRTATVKARWRGQQR